MGIPHGVIMTRLTWTIVIALAAFVVGCGDKPVAAPVEPEKARQALRTALGAWKGGQTIDSLAQATPPIIAQDFDWMAGAKLTEYQLLDDGQAEDANLRVKVKLSIRDKQGQAVTKTVVYVVGTDPKLTVFRGLD